VTERAASGSSAGLRAAQLPLCELYDVALLDLDGVVYLGTDAVPGAAEHLAATVQSGMRLGFVTNNASRTPAEVAAQLTRLGVPAGDDQVVTSAQTAARVLSDRLPAAARVLVVGTDALVEQVNSRGLTAARDLARPVAAVVQGFSPHTGWQQLAAASRAVRDGAWWVATNADLTVPSVHGALPGNGSFLAAVTAATGLTPEVTGKPEPAMHIECLQRLRATHPLVVGDRLDTDIEGAARVGCPSLLVLTGVTRPVDLLSAPAEHRPTYLAADLSGLRAPHPVITAQAGGWRCGGWLVRTERSLTLTGAGNAIDALRALCAAAWAEGPAPVRACGSAAEAALAGFGIDAG